MPTTRYFRKLTFTDGTDTGIYEFVQWLTNEHGTETGPGWDVIEAYDGTDRDVPSGGVKLANLPAGNAWIDGEGTGKITVDGAWIVLRSKDANNTNHFELYIERGSSTVLNFILIPLDNFTTGGAATSPPAFPATAVGAGGSLVTFNVTAGTNKWYGVSDEGMAFLLIDNGAANGIDAMYVGELDQARIGGSTVDDRCYVIWDDPADWLDGDNTGSRHLNRLSPMDDVTILTLGQVGHVKQDSSASSVYMGTPDNGLGEESVGACPVIFTDTSHFHIAGVLRNVYMGGSWLSPRGTLGGVTPTYAHFSDFILAEVSCVLAWDGVTAVP